MERDSAHPLAWGADEPISYTFIKKGLAKERVEEILRVINWCSAPFGTTEFVKREYGVEGKHHTKTADGPVKTELGFKEIQNQYFFISGRSPVVQPYPQTPDYVPQVMAYSNETVKYLEKDPWDGLKFEMPAKFKAGAVPTQDKITDVLPALALGGREVESAFEDGRECLAGHQLHHEVGAALFLAVVEDVGDSIMVDQRGVPCFSAETLKEAWVAHVF